jgi:hypothetical protein
VRGQDRRLIVKDAFLRFLAFMQTLCCGEFISRKAYAENPGCFDIL